MWKKPEFQRQVTHKITSYHSYKKFKPAHSTKKKRIVTVIEIKEDVYHFGSLRQQKNILKANKKAHKNSQNKWNVSKRKANKKRQQTANRNSKNLWIPLIQTMKYSRSKRKEKTNKTSTQILNAFSTLEVFILLFFFQNCLNVTFF